MKKRFFIYIILTIFFLSFVSAGLNVSLADQGGNVKNKTSGNLVSTANLTVSIFDASTEGNLIYNETFVSAISNGSWNVMLGANESNPLTLEFGKIYYKDYVLNGFNLNFTNMTGDITDRQVFYSPLGSIGGEDISTIANLTVANLSASGNVTASAGFFTLLGNLINRITSLFVQNIDFTGNINGSGNITTIGRVGIGIESPSSALDVRGQGNFSGTIFINNATDISTFNGNASFNQTLTDSLYGSGGNTTWNQTTANGLYAPNTTFGIQNLIENSSIGRVGNCSLGQMVQNITPTGVQCIADQTSAGAAGNPFNQILNTTSNVTFWNVNISGILNVTSSIFLQGGINISNWITNISTNWTSLADAYTDERINLINTTFGIGQLYNLTASMIANLSISQNSGMNASWNQTTANTLYAPNTTFGIQQLINGTNMKFGSVDFNNGWASGGVSIIGGSLFAQIVYVYNLSSLNVNNILTNGSLFPSFDNSFNLGNISSRWKEMYLSGNIYSNGTLYINNGIDVTLFNDTTLALSINTTAQQALTINTTKNIQNLYNSTLTQGLGYINITKNIQELLNTTGVYSLPLTINTTKNIQNLYNFTASQIANLSISQTSGVNSSWNQTLGNLLYAPNTTIGIQILYNSTLTQGLGYINITKNIQELLNSTGIYDTYNATYAAINSTINIQNLIGNSTIARVGNCTAGQIIQNITQDGVQCVADQTSSAAGNPFNQILNTTSNVSFADVNISGILNVTGSIWVQGGINISNWITNISTNWTALAINTLSSNFTAINTTATLGLTINTTKNIQELLNSTGIYSLPLTINNTLNLQTILNSTGIYSTYNATYAAINSTFNIQGLYNFTASQIANLSISQTSGVNSSWNQTLGNLLYAPNTTFGIQNLYNSTLIQGLGYINITKNIQELLNSTGIYSLPLTINTTKNIQNLYNSTALQYAQLINVTAALAFSINTTKNIQELLNSTGIYDTYNVTYAAINTTATLGLTINTTKNIQNLYNSTALQYAQLINVTAALAFSINTTKNIQELLNSTGIYSLPLTINTTLNIQNLLNGTNIYFTGINVTNNITLGGDMTINSSKAIYFNTDGKKIYSNITCIIIKGTVSTLEIC